MDISNPVSCVEQLRTPFVAQQYIICTPVLAGTHGSRPCSMVPLRHEVASTPATPSRIVGRPGIILYCLKYGYDALYEAQFDSTV